MDWIIVLLVYAAFIYGVYKLAKSKNRDVLYRGFLLCEAAASGPVVWWYRSAQIKNALLSHM